MNASPTTWKYLKEKYCTTRGLLDERYPHLLKNDPLIAAAYRQIEIAERAIDSRMAELADALDGGGDD